MERLEFDLLFRWFVGLGIDDAVWDHSVFSKNRDRLLEGDVAAKFLAAVLTQPNVKQLLSTDHFSVDGTLVEAWAEHEEPQAEEGDSATILPRAAGAMKRSTSVARSGATRHTPPPAIPMPCSIARVLAWRPSFVTSAIP